MTEKKRGIGGFLRTTPKNINKSVTKGMTPMGIKEGLQVQSWGLKKKLLLGFMFIAFIPAVTISVFYYVDSKKALEANVGDTYVILLGHILNNVEQQIEEAYQFTNWLYLDRDVLRLLQRTPEEPNVMISKTSTLSKRSKTSSASCRLWSILMPSFFWGITGLTSGMVLTATGSIRPSLPTNPGSSKVVPIQPYSSGER